MPGYTIDLAHGPRAAEDKALARIRELRRQAAATGSPLAAPPLWVVVPSRSLRVHLLRRLAESGGPEVALGVRCATVYGVALELAEVRSTTLPELVAVLAERFARDERALRALARLSDGYAIVTAAVRDLLDAGFEPAHLDGLREALEQPEARSAGRAACERAAALLRVASRVEQACEEGDLPARYRVYRHATDAVASGRGPRLQAVVVHGFAEATGVVSDLLEALLKTYGGCLTLDRPHDPFVSGRLAGDGAFTERLLARLRGASSSEHDEPGDEIAPRPRLVVAARPEVEVEEVAHRVLDLLADGQAPEEIGVVMRDPAPYRLTLRRRFDALGVPFSTAGVDGASLPHRRRISSLLALLEDGERLPVDRWLELLPPETDATPSDLALALAVRGAGRLAAAAAVPDDWLHGETPVRLPVRRVRAAGEDGESETIPQEEPFDDTQGLADAEDRHPQIPRSALRHAVERARATMRGLDRLRRRQGLGEHLRELRGLVADALAWAPEDPARVELEERVLRPVAELPADWPLELDELRRLLSDLLVDAGRSDLGGGGAGVRVLDVVAARAHTFDHLFLLGTQRGRFPRQVREDPLLPDTIRDVLATHGFGPLPDLPRKRTGHDEEAHLFAQLLAAAPHVSLSWSRADADGEPLSPSPWIDRLRSATAPESPGPTPEAALPVWGDPEDDGENAVRRLARRPPEEWVRLAGLHGSRVDVARLLPHAVAEVLQGAPENVSVVASARLAILDELDPDLGEATGWATWRRLGPFSGIVGPTASGKPSTAADATWVTRLEAMARCPWQHFLEHTLRLEAWPDPLADLPALDRALIGRFVHAVLQRLVTDSGAAGETMVADAVAAAAVPVPWPATERFERTLAQVARELLADEGIHLPGLARGLVELSRPMIERARDPHWKDVPPTVVGSELDATVEVAGSPIAFRADLALLEEAGIRFVDFKTSAPLSAAKKPDTRHNHLLAAIARGKALQVAVYAASRSGPPVAGGAYHFLTDRADPSSGSHYLALDSDDAEARERMRAAAERLLEARRLGVYPPRLTGPAPGDNRTPPACDWCAVRQACLQGDTTARTRQRRWVDARQQPSRLADAGERALATLWWMWDPDWPQRLAEAER